MSLEFTQDQNSIIVRDGKFCPPHEQKPGKTIELKSGENFTPADFSDTDIAVIVINVLAFNDGRAFSQAKKIRTSGFKGILRLKGPVIADQYPLAIRCGFDELEISASEAKRQPQFQWSDALKRTRDNYLTRLTEMEVNGDQSELSPA
ncbi:MAG: DUF934 domain-containing protein [Devosiaceae bacterium]|nr:DUF934 domain-containing protein [Devosiaceae bacterium]